MKTNLYLIVSIALSSLCAISCSSKFDQKQEEDSKTEKPSDVPTESDTPEATLIDQDDDDKVFSLLAKDEWERYDVDAVIDILVKYYQIKGDFYYDNKDLDPESFAIEERKFLNSNKKYEALIDHLHRETIYETQIVRLDEVLENIKAKLNSDELYSRFINECDLEDSLELETFTEFVLIKDDYIEPEDANSVDEIYESPYAIGASDFDQGTDDISVIREHKTEVIVEEKKPEMFDNDKPFESVEQMPQFPGGDAALQKYVAEHMQYPERALDNGTQGRVVVRFVVKKDGSIGDAQVVRKVDPDLDKEALRIIKSLPHFIPGQMNGQNVAVWFTMPVNFKLANQ